MGSTTARDLDEVASLVTIFVGALCVVSGGAPLTGDDCASLRIAMELEGVPDNARTRLLEIAARGASATDLPANPRFERDQAKHLVAALVLFAVRRGHGALDAVVAIAASYRLREHAVRQLAVEFARLPRASPPGLAHDLAEILDPPAGFDPVVENVLGAGASIRGPRSIAWLSPSRIQHPADRDALRLAQQIPGFDDMAAWIIEHGVERGHRILNVASRIRVSARQFAPLYEMFRALADRTGVDPEPELYVEAGGLDAYTTGYERPFIVLGSAMVSLFTRAELEFVLAHEMGHIRSEHMLYHYAADTLASTVARVPGAALVSAGLRLALLEWSRKSELSADRFGLLACQDLDTALTVMMKLAGAPVAFYRELDIDAFIAQHSELEQASGVLDTLFKLDAARTMTHPWGVVRAHELAKFHASADYAELLAGAVPHPDRRSARVLPPPALPFTCPLCATRVPSHERACRGCHAPLREADRMRPCPACHEPTPPLDRFCETCGAATQPLVRAGGSP